MEVMVSSGKTLSSTFPRCFSLSTSPAATASSPPSTPPSQPPTAGPAAPPQVVLSPCAACKTLRRRCAEKCLLAPYFPPTDPLKFSIAHKVFGASNIIKLLQELPESQRADAVSSMVYEAQARLRDPVYGSAGTICHLQKQVSSLQAELAKAQAEIVNMKCQQANLLTMLCMEMTSNPSNTSPTHSPQDHLLFTSLPTSPVQSDEQFDGPLSVDYLNFYADCSNCTRL